MPASSSRDDTRFPPSLSARIAAEIERLAWNETDLLEDIPEQQPDVMYLASMYADEAADRWETANECAERSLPYRIVEAARRALIPRIEAEIDRRERLVEAEYRERSRRGLIDVNGVGDVPAWYELVDEQMAEPPSKPDQSPGRESDRPGGIGPEVLIMSEFAKRGVVAFWHFECSECGFSDAEFGAPGTSHDTIHCEVCLEDGLMIRLKRWPVEETVPRRQAA